jgi:hypothetical protein
MHPHVERRAPLFGDQEAAHSVVGSEIAIHQFRCCLGSLFMFLSMLCPIVFLSRLRSSTSPVRSPSEVCTCESWLRNTLPR